MVSLPDHAWLDRVVRGRAWIPLLGVLLAGIVAAQVEILKLGATMGRALEQTSALTNQNEQLRGSVAALSDDQRIQRMAGAMGLVLPPPGAVGYLLAGRDGNVSGALDNLNAPDSSAFVAMAPKNGALVTGQGTSTLPPVAGAPAPPASTTSTSNTASTSSTTSTSSMSSTSSASSTTSTSAGTAVAPTTTAAGTSSTTGAASTTGSAPTTTSTAPATTQATSALPPTGAAAIQPADSTQPSSGG